MNKYDNMLASNKKTSERKIELAKQIILNMLEEHQKVTIPKLVDRTGLSRGFFYKNPEVRKLVDNAMERQAGMKDARRGILDIAMNNEIEKLQQKIKILEQEKAELKNENEKLLKALNKRLDNKMRTY